MKINYILKLVLVLLISANINAQNWYLNQVLVGSGGNFSDPDNHVTISSYNTINQITSDFGSILTQSIQDIIIVDNYAYIAAQDSIAKYDIDSYEKLAITSAIGVNKLHMANNKLVASFQYPEIDNFIKIYEIHNLDLISSISEVSGEAAGLTSIDNFIYAAVNGGWAGTGGKIAIIDIHDLSFIQEVNLDSLGKGIKDLFVHENQVLSVNATPWGGTTGHISVIDQYGSISNSYMIPATIGSLVGVKNNMIYTVMNNGIGSIDMETMTIVDESVIDQPPLTISCAKLDTLNNEFYVSTTNYSSMGEGTIFDLNGFQIGSYTAEISPDAMAFDYRDNSNINEAELYLTNIYPNPASSKINVQTQIDDVKSVIVVDNLGRIIYENSGSNFKNLISIDISSFNSGIYTLRLTNNVGVSSSKFIKQ
mgnify:FL=1